MDKNNEPVTGIVTFRLNSKSKRRIRCDICIKYPNIVKQYYSKKPPEIITAKGARFLTHTLSSQVKSPYHIECLNANRIESLKTNVGADIVAPMDVAINKANRKMINHVGKLMIQIYNDAKSLSLSAHSWPGRFVAAESSSAYVKIKPNA